MLVDTKGGETVVEKIKDSLEIVVAVLTIIALTKQLTKKTKKSKKS
jgi:hypothetical protein